MKCMMRVSYMLRVILLHKILLWKTPKEGIICEAQLVWWNYIDIGLKVMRYESVDWIHLDDIDQLLSV